MQYAVISDVHANLEALSAVLSDIKKRGLKKVLFLGDAVGYGPNPNECTELLKETSEVLLAGNHDWAVLGLTDIEYFNEHARDAILWTESVISEKSRKILSQLHITKNLSVEDIFLVHSTPKSPEEWHYLLTSWDAEVNFHYFKERICLLGHSHLPFIIEKLPSGEMIVHKEKTEIKKQESRYIINVGSVGQPRDHNPKACYAVIDNAHVELLRVQYDIEKTQKKMSKVGLPEPLVERLPRGT
ncbi:MAG: metallophosphoesterase family protein [Nitrospirae bacterium]|nr:metallophosphoesterase family protein [Nitrospirota bacterium]